MFLNLLLLLASLALSGLAIIPSHYHFREHLNKAVHNRGNDDVSVTTAYMAQFLDHFTGNLSGFFNQRYYYTQHFTLHQKVAFLYVSNKGDFERAVITDERNPIVKAAQQFGATIFSLEHRYYGDSKPNYDKFDSNSLRYLNSWQAVRDIIAFIKYANVQFNLDPDVRWVLWGAGYGGVIAAEARKWDPITVSGVIASSSPLTHQYDFWKFNNHVALTISIVGGSYCYQKVEQGFADIRQAMRTPEGRANVSELFQLNPPLNETNLDYNDVQMFYLAIIAPFQELVQFNNDFNLSISDMCTTIDKSNWTNMEVVYQAYAYLSTTLTGTVQPLITSYQQLITNLGNQSPTGQYIDQRMWEYQACTEFAWFYTTNNNEKGLFGAVVPSSLFLNQCFDLFPGANLTATSIRDSVINYNNIYGASDDYSGTNAVFTNGEYDPWSGLGKESSQDFSVVPYIITGASYAADMFPKDNISTYVNIAHSIMIENIKVWVNMPRNPKTFVNTTQPWTRPHWGDTESFREVKLKEEAESRFSKLPDDIPSKKTFPEPKFRKMFLGRPPHGFLPEPDFNLNEDAYPAGFEQGTFRQRQDHFNNQNPNVFQQKFYKNAQWAKPGGPNFLMIGGEGPESARWVLNENITYLTWAQKYGATVYLLEHRFYGDSLVGNNTEFSLLTSLQMLYDLADFIKYTNIKTGTSNPWITFGGSYSGAMSAWMREVFPELVIGAVASSGPVYAKTDFYEYLMVVENSIRRYNSTCADRIQSGFNTIRMMFLTKEGRQSLSDIFQLQPPFADNVTDTDQHYFFSNIYSAFQGAVQYSGDNTGAYASGYGIPDMCKFMTNDSDTPLNNIVAFNQFMTVFNNDGAPYTGMDNNYQDMIDYLKNAQKYGPNAGASLLWTWQTCTEFGYFQSADSGNGIFGSPTPVNFYINMCMDLFSPYDDRTMIDSAIDNTNWKYGERFFYRGTNVVLPNGNVDPWHALGLYDPLDKTVVPYLIDGTAHCADMYPARDADVPGLKVVRDLIDQNIATWLSQESSTATTATGNESTYTYTPTIQTTTEFVSSATILITFIVVPFRYLLF